MSGINISGNNNITICSGGGAISVNGMTIESSTPISIINGTVILPAGAACTITGSGSIQVATEGADLNGSTSPESGKASEKTFEISEPFTSIVNEASADVRYTPGTDVSVVAHGNSAALDKLDIRVMGSTLYVGMKPGTYSISNLLVEVTAPSVNDFTNRGSGDTTITGKLEAEAGCSFRTSGSGEISADEVVAGGIISVSCSGSGDVQMKKASAKFLDIRVNSSADVTLASVKATQVNVAVTGSGDVRLAGAADKIDLSVTGSGDIAAGRLKATSGCAQVMGSGDITANVSGHFSTRCLGSGDIENVN